MRREACNQPYLCVPPLQVLIAQERMANNHVYCFKKSQPSKYLFVAECRSIIENSTRSTSTMSVNLTSRARKASSLSGSIIVAQIPYIKSDVNVIILFRALGFVADKVRAGQCKGDAQAASRIALRHASVRWFFGCSAYCHNVLVTLPGQLVVGMWLIPAVSTPAAPLPHCRPRPSTRRRTSWSTLCTTLVTRP